MPKPARAPGDVEAIKEKILDAALDILFDQGFSSLSMRKIALGTKMTAANIYNYFSNKDEIYLAIQTRGFSLLHERFCEIEKTIKDPFARMGQMIRAYIDFGLNCPDQYEIMFSKNTPKYSDYIGTGLEPAAMVEKETALVVARISTRTILDMNKTTCPGEAKYLTIRIWTSLHGIVSLMNSRVLREVNQDTDMIIEKLTEDLMKPFGQKGQGEK
ncbi:MAG: TetR/AcrR family transcriptional regulator [Desulfobacteraceae bacterium]|nr:TetR/AcrR family transcriptional regulator [Desulfobacteraceae bacterium]